MMDYTDRELDSLSGMARERYEKKTKQVIE